MTENSQDAFARAVTMLSSLRKNIDKTKLTKITKEEKESIPQLAFVCLFRKNVG